MLHHLGKIPGWQTARVDNELGYPPHAGVFLHVREDKRSLAAPPAGIAIHDFQ
jgi:hypothetical protein